MMHPQEGGQGAVRGIALLSGKENNGTSRTEKETVPDPCRWGSCGRKEDRYWSGRV